MNLIEEIAKLDNLFSYERVSDSSEMEADIISQIRSVNSEIISSYSVQKDYLGILLAIYERHDTRSVSYLISLVSHLLQLDTFPIIAIPTSIIEDPENIPEALAVMEKIYSQLKATSLDGIRLSSDFELLLDQREKLMFIGTTNYMLNGLARREQIEQSDITTALQNLSIVRNLAKSLGEIELFYILLRSLFDILQRHEKYQLARDVAEDCLACGYKDGMEDVAYSQVLRVYANTASMSAALHYCLGALTFQTEKKRIVDFAYKGIVTSLVKLFRNAQQYALSRTFYEQRSKLIPFNDYEERSLHVIYLSIFLAVGDPRAPQMIVDYLDKQREAVIAGGEMEALPWLTLLYNIAAIYKEEYVGSDQCKRYRSLFEQIVPAVLNSKKRLGRSFFPTSLDELSSHLKAALTNLASTRNETDFTTDNTRAGLISNRLIRMSFDQEEWRSYLLAMIINSDYSITFKQTLVPEVMEIKDDQRSFADVYHTPDDIADVLQNISNSSTIWLGTDDRQVYPVVYARKEFIFCKNSIFSFARFQQWIDNDFAKLPLEETKISIAGIKMQKTSDDYRLEENELAGRLEFTALDTYPAENVLIVKDYQISSFPHNLLLCKKNGFVINQSPVMNIMSVEWLLEKIRNPRQPVESFSKGVWIPTETGDYVLNYLYSYIEEKRFPIMAFSSTETRSLRMRFSMTLI